MRNPTDQVIDAAVRAAPPAAVTFYTQILDRPIQEWVGILTIIYIALQIFLLIRDRIVHNRRATDEKP